MPRVVRNFWLEANIDGRRKNIAGGPREKTGGFALTVHMRQEGGVTTPLEVVGDVVNDTLRLSVKYRGTQREVVSRIETRR